MHGVKRDLTGLRFGRWTVLRFDRRKKHTSYYWWCRCACGVEKSVRSNGLTCGKSESCGCGHREAVTSHQMCATRQYGIWAGVVSRCRNSNDIRYHRYGGRGITVDSAWAESFEVFWEDMKDGYQDHLTLHRLDDGNYCKQDCVWATEKRQSRERRDNRIIDTPLGKMTVAEAAERANVTWGCMSYRDKVGWPMENLFDPSNRKAT